MLHEPSSLATNPIHPHTDKDRYVNIPATIEGVPNVVTLAVTDVTDGSCIICGDDRLRREGLRTAKGPVGRSANARCARFDTF